MRHTFTRFQNATYKLARGLEGTRLVLDSEDKGVSMGVRTISELCNV